MNSNKITTLTIILLLVCAAIAFFVSKNNKSDNITEFNERKSESESETKTTVPDTIFLSEKRKATIKVEATISQFVVSNDTIKCSIRNPNTNVLIIEADTCFTGTQFISVLMTNGKNKTFIID